MSEKKLKLTTKQAKFVKAKAEGKSGTQAAMEAYNVANPRTASVIAVENLAKPSIQQALYAEFEKQGITLEAIVKPIKEGLTASKIIVMGKDSNESFVDLTPDHAVRLKASGMAAQFIGIGKAPEGGTTNYNFINVAQEHKDKYNL